MSSPKKEEEAGMWIEVSGGRIQASHSLEGTVFFCTILFTNFQTQTIL